MNEEHLENSTVLTYNPEEAQQALVAIEESQEVVEEDNAPISREKFLLRLRRAIEDAYTWIDFAEELGQEIEEGGKVKRTKLAANVRVNRLSLLVSSLNDVRYAKVVD